MVKTVGVIDWVPQPGYPELSGKPGGEVLTCKYIVSADRMDGLPEYNTPYKNELYRFFNGFDYLLLKQRNVKTLPGGGHYEVTLIYEQSDAQLLDVSTSAVEIECEQDTREETYPLEYRPNYRCRWNRRLLARRDTAPTVPDWWSAAATTVIPVVDQDDYRWISPGDQVPDGWYELCSETKPGVDGFLGGVVVVTVTKRSARKSKLIKDARLDYTICEPPETFGVDGEWLRGGSSMRKEGRYWVQTVQYTNTTSIDRDFYD